MFLNFIYILLLMLSYLININITNDKNLILPTAIAL